MREYIRQRIEILREIKDSLEKDGDDTSKIDESIANLGNGTTQWRWIENSIKSLREEAEYKPGVGPRFTELLDEVEAIATTAEADEFLSTL